MRTSTDPDDFGPGLPRGALAALVVGVAAACWPAPGAAQAPGGGIYTCTDASGNKHTSDRLISACSDREQRVLNGDGSVRTIVPPMPTADERADIEAREARKAAERRTQQDLIRRDRNLLIRFPNEASHQKAREAALDDIRQAIGRSQVRLKDLAIERKPLLSEAEFYVNRTLPPLLKQQLDANDASTDAQRALVQNQQVELGRINATFDAELSRLRKLWAGAPAGSLGPMRRDSSASAALPAPAAARPAEAGTSAP